ncbi:MAG: TRAP transporter small permease [Allorhizobium sp.]
MTEANKKGSASAGPLFDIVARAVSALTALVLVALVVLVCAEAFLRGVANISLGFAEEVTGYFVVMLTLSGAALALRSGSLFQVHFLFQQLSTPVRAQVTRAFVIVSLMVCGVLAWKGYDVMMSSLERGKFAPTVLRTPLWVPQMLLPFGFSLIGFFLIEQFLLSGAQSRESD